MRARLPLFVAALGIGAAAVAAWLFPRAFPAIALDNRLTQTTALARADSFFAAHGLAGGTTRRAVRFGADDSLLTYVDLAAGGTDSVNALVRSRDVALFSWTVRAFEPGDVHEASAELATDGRVMGFVRKLANTDTLPGVTPDSATSLARAVIADWLGEPPGRWNVVTTSYQTRKESGRVDRTVTFERTDRKVGDAPMRLDVVIAGNTPVEARPYIEVPEGFRRRYTEMRSANDLLALLATLGIVGLGLAAVLTIRRFARAGVLRWRAPLAIGSVIGALLGGAGANAMGAAWFSYDTALPAGLFEALTAAGALASGVTMGIVVALTLVAAEAAARHAFPDKLDWWRLWRARGTREVAAHVGGGYALAAFGFAYVALFYLFTRNTLGWWVPSELLQDPNQIATPMPWLAGIAMSLQAGVWEESLFRALPLSLLALWARDRTHREWWMRAGIVGTALIFGFAHSNYPSWPPYSRGFELFVEATIWAVLFLRVGLLVTVLAHFVYDLVLFSLFTATGSAPEYRISAAIALVALLAPALAVAWRLVRQRGFEPLPDGARFGDWVPAPAAPHAAAPPPAVAARGMAARERWLALFAIGCALAAAVALPRPRARGPEFTVGKARVVSVADSMLGARADSSARAVISGLGDAGSGWRRLVVAAADTLSSWPRFLHEHGLDSLAQALARSYVPPAWWTVRYVRTTGSPLDRADEWRLRVLPDGTPLDTRRIVSDSMAGGAPPPDSVRRMASRALAEAGIDTLRLAESDFHETERPHRRDATVTYADTTIELPAGATARAWVTLAGSELLLVRRGVELPQRFQRAERERTIKAAAMAGLLAVLFLGAIVAGTIVVARRRTPLDDSRTFGRSASVRLLILLAAAALAAALNNWPSAMFGYDTAASWGNHVATVLLTIAMSPIVVLLVAGFWQVMEMLRKRTPIAALPADAAGLRDATLAGAGLGAVLTLGELAAVALRGTVMGVPPSTTLDAAMPIVAGALQLPNGVAMTVATAAIPLLVVVAITRNVRLRWAIAAATVVVSAAVLAPVADALGPTPPGPAEMAAGVAGAVLGVAALVRWGPRGPYAWLVAAMTMAAVNQTRAAVHAVTGVERGAAALAILLLAAGALWIHAYARARGAAPGGDDRETRNVA